MSAPLQPPRLATRLLLRRVPERWREFVVGDLEEEFRSRAAANPSAARGWFWRQALRCAVRPPRQAQAYPYTTFSPGDPWMHTLLGDIRYAVRVLRRSPSFALAVVSVFAIGIGANTAIFTIVNTVLLRPLPFENSDRLVRLFHVPPQSTFPGMKMFSISPANFYDWQRSARSFEGMALYRSREFALTGSGNAQSVVAVAVGSGFFDIVGTKPELGRTFLPEEDSPAHGHVVVLSDGFWKSHFGGAPDIVGRTLTLDDQPFDIVGVMPARFTNRAWAATARDLWVPLAQTDTQKAVRDNHNFQAVARLRPGVTLEQADGEMQAISRRLEVEYPKENAGWGATVVSLRELIVGDVRLSLVMLLSAVALVLLIACANVGNLLFARALARRKEIAIRSALGAARSRVFRQLLVETLLLASAGGALGLFLARQTLSAGATLLADRIPRADELSMDWRVVLFVVGVSLLTGILAGTLPAVRAGRTDLNEALKEGGRQDSAVGVRTRRLLIVCEVALSVVLLMGAALMIRTLVNLRNIDAGFDPHGVLTMRVSISSMRYHSGGQMFDLLDRTLAELRAVPGVQSAGAIDDLPVTGGSVQPIVLEGHAELLPKDQPTVNVRTIRPGYLSTMRVPVVRGRDITESDDDVMLVSRAAAKLLWGDEDPIGRRVRLPLQSKTGLVQVIGIVGDVKQSDLTEPANPTVYQATRQPITDAIAKGSGGSFGLAIVLRSAVPPLSIAQTAVAAVHRIDPAMPVDEVKTMDAILDDTTSSQRFSATLLGVFAGVALILASVGIYSVLSYIVRGRSREIGIRTALGASTTAVVRMVILEGMTPAAIGIAIGAAGALLSGRLLEKLVFGISASDPLTLVLVAGSLAAVALLASLIPAYRASRVDPIAVLRV
ncbi:MAG TPA: ABC transporter permease [Vicinamibacterales bacterium]|nr:ABC transporter permease [Vicinamibacterales bacterium]